MTYHTLTAPCQAQIEIKKSEFLGFAYPITDREQLMFHVEQLRTQYPDARHICYGYIIGDPNNTTSAGFDDDGEPGGTAGKPILNVLQHKAIGNCAILVVRYFGGIKLGAGGLTRAYSGTAQAVVDNMTLAEFVPMTEIDVETDFANESFVRHQVNSIQGDVLSTEYGKQVKLTISLAENSLAEFKEKLGFYGKILPNDQTN